MRYVAQAVSELAVRWDMLGGSLTAQLLFPDRDASHSGQPHVGVQRCFLRGHGDTGSSSMRQPWVVC